MIRTGAIDTLLFALLLALLSGCEGGRGPAGPPGPSGANPRMPPVVTAVLAFPDSIGLGERTSIVAVAYDPNGDSMSYQWSAETGTVVDSRASRTYWVAPNETGIQVLRVTVSDSTGSDTDSVYVAVNAHRPLVFPSYLGDDEVRCAACHSGETQTWRQSDHAGAWETLVAQHATGNPYCVQCHATGYDTRVNLDGSVAQRGIDNGGYDDDPRTTLQDVQCEQCHGPMGPLPSYHAPQSWSALTGEACERCHEQYPEWAAAGHGAVLNRMSREEMYLEWASPAEHREHCQYCHLSEGFLKHHDPDWAERAITADAINPVTCVTCHDPHGNDNPFALRAIDTVMSPYGGSEFPNGYVIDRLGEGQLCAHCHHASRTLAQVTDQIEHGSAHPGPHPSPQADMLSGRGGYEILDMSYQRVQQHARVNVPNTCVDCHSLQIPMGMPGGPYHGHSFAPDLRTCTGVCHTNATSFDVGRVQTETRALLDQLAALLPQDSSGNVRAAMDTVYWTRVQREAGYAYFFVSEDKSFGVHNRDYASTLLTNAIDHLTLVQP